MRNLYVPLVLALTTGDALAARWVSIVEGATRAIYLDTAGVVRDGSQVRVWTREVYTQEQRSEQVGVYYYSANSLTSYDCARRTWAPLFKVFYGGDGTELRRVALDAVEPPVMAAPGSMQESMLERACAPVAKAPAKDEARRTRPPAQGAQVRPAAASSDAMPVSASAPSPAPLEAPAASGAPPKEPAAKDTVAAAQAPASAKPERAGNVQPKPPTATVAAHESSARVADGPMRPAPAHPYVKRATPVRVAAQQPKRVAPAQPVGPRAAPEAHEPVHWSYAGAGSPERWAELDPEFGACGGGKRQSPIDIKDGARLELEPIRFDYRAAPLRIVDNGHTVQVNYAEGSSIQVAGERYALKQFHFHKPAEERIDGRSFDLTAHLVHESFDGRLAVLAVLFEARQQPNAFLRSLWPYLPLEQGREIAPGEVTVDVNGLLPEARTYFTYMGSLTIPPCSEGVLWIVLKTPVEMSPEQVAVFSKLYTMNARPVQPAHGRLIKESM